MRTTLQLVYHITVIIFKNFLCERILETIELKTHANEKTAITPEMIKAKTEMFFMTLIAFFTPLKEETMSLLVYPSIRWHTASTSFKFLTSKITLCWPDNT